MSKGKWNSLALLGGVAALGTAVLFVSLNSLRLLDWTGLAWCAALLVLTVGAGRFTVNVQSADGTSQNNKSFADAFIFLAAMMYGAGLATVLAAIDGFGSSRRTKDRRMILFATGTAILSTYIAVFLYTVLTNLLMRADQNSASEAAPLSLLLLPLCVLALIQYFLNTAATATFIAFESGTSRLTISRESLVWTSMTQVAGASAAALFYTAWQGGGVPFLFLGALLMAMVYFLYRFNEQRIREFRRAESEKLTHIQEMSDLHMNTIESLAIAIDAKDQTTHGHVRRTQIYAMELGRILGVTLFRTRRPSRRGVAARCWQTRRA